MTWTGVYLGDVGACMRVSDRGCLRSMFTFVIVEMIGHHNPVTER